MGATQTILDSIEAAALAEFADSSHIGFGTGTTAEAPSQTTLTTEIIRNAFDEAVIEGVGTLDYSATLGLTEGNSNTFAEVGLFNAASSGTMYARKLLTTTVAKTSTMELSVGIRVSISVTGA
jgi:hypothetical protein